MVILAASSSERNGMQSRNSLTPRTASRPILLVALVESTECLLLGLAGLSSSLDLRAGSDMIKWRKIWLHRKHGEAPFQGLHMGYLALAHLQYAYDRDGIVATVARWWDSLTPLPSLHFDCNKAISQLQAGQSNLRLWRR